MIEIIQEPSEENPFAVIYKPHNYPSAPLSEEDKHNALSECVSLFPELGNVQGKKEIEKGLLHRLDTATDGLIVIAATQSAFDFLDKKQKEGQFKKFYLAQVQYSENLKEGFPERPSFDFEKGGTVKSFFRPYGKGNAEVRPVNETSGKAALKKLKNPVEYETHVEIIEKANDSCKVLCSIVKGFRHQVRCHLSWIGLPIINDPLYNEKACHGDILFTAVKVEFPHPITGKTVSFEINKQ